jgi:NADPH-dependent 2,4-dienoyl-CoA reductase/sulfur reductase-like enzyme
VLDAASGRAVAELHRANGVDVRLGAGVAGFRSSAGSVSGVELADGTVIDTDTVVVGIGVVPNVGWLEGAGLELDNGVVCDETCLAADGVVAAGDVANWSNRRFGTGPMRIEQWDNAVEQGGYVARRLLAWAADETIEPFAPVPWFWSDQYDRKIQLAGRTSDRVELLQGTLEDQRFVQMYLDDDGRPVGVQAWNRPRQAIQSRQLLANEADADEFRSTLGPPPG